IARDANSAADVISHIRALFRRAPHARATEDMNGLIREVRRLMADELASKAIRFEESLDPGLPSASFDRVQIQQVLVNLVRNGMDAMEAVGERSRVLEVRSHSEVDALCVEICDQGAGFKDDAARVFDPFFTTKQNGMGMGLTICRSIIEAHGGR